KFMDGGEESIVYTQISGNYVVMLNTMITPVNATVSTLRSQLVYLSLIFGVLGLLFAALISKRISKPIMVTNESAKELAEGNVNVHFDGEGYREITELNSTLNYA
ncbi:MAG: two-component sensor histidine kinase, partial [Eubacterium sp.]